MRIDRLKLSHYRNYEALDISFAPGLNILTGANAQGKTNLLEAIFMLAMGKSHRTHSDKDLIRWGQDRAMIEAQVALRHYQETLALHLLPKGKIAKVNQIEQAKMSHFIGHLNVVLFAPEDIQLIKGSPSLRRRFIDAELVQSQPVYLQTLIDYQRVLKQRNTYLKNYGDKASFDTVYFEILTQQLVEYAIPLVHARLAYIEAMNTYAQPILHDLSQSQDSLTLTYTSSSSQLDYTQPDSLYEQYIKRYETAMDRERRQGVTLYGPHRDDLLFQINDRDAQHYASQGQQRSIILALKFAEIEWLYDQTQEYPILLLDDVLSELDDQRQAILLQFIEGKVQTFLTTASLEGVTQAPDLSGAIYYVTAGQIDGQMKENQDARR